MLNIITQVCLSPLLDARLISVSINLFHAWETEKANLLDGAVGLEEDPSAEQLGKDTAHGPHIDRGRVMLGAH